MDGIIPSGLPYAGKGVHVLDVEIGKGIDELDLEIREGVDKLPASAGIRKSIDTLNVQVRQCRDDLYPEIRESVNDLDFAVQFPAFVSTVVSCFRCPDRGGR